MLETTWFILWGVLFAVYFMLDGFDLGLGTLMPFLARDDRERRIIYNAMGPFWDGNEVWFITAGGVTFAAFPTVYAVMFSTLYTPLMLILLALILRGVSFEFRGKEDHPLWRKTFDAAQTGGSFLAALLLGVAFANIFMGIPFDAAGNFHGNLFTLLNPYGLAGGVLFLLLFCWHGANWLTVKSTGELQERARRMSARLWPTVLIVAVIFLIATWYATPLWKNYLNRPVMLAIPLLALAAMIISPLLARKKNAWGAWGTSGATILLVTLFGVGGLFPNLYPSRLDPTASLTCFNSASSPLTLKIMLGVALTFVPLVIIYQSVVYYLFRHPVSDTDLAQKEAY